jgi:hypothetical protein
MTSDPVRRTGRAFAAARAQRLSCDFEGALLSLAAAQAGPLDELGRANADLLRAQLEFAVNRGADAVGLFLRAARQFEGLDVALARDAYMEAISAAQFAGRLAIGEDVVAIAGVARSAPPMPAARASDQLLDGLATLIADRPEPPW